MHPRAALLGEIDAYLSRHNIAATTFGRLAVNDGKFVGRLRNGGNITWATAERVRVFIEQRRPPAPGRPACEEGTS